MALGFVGAGGVKGGADALQEIIAQRLLEQKLEEARMQQEFENRMATRQADTGDARFERTQGLSEELGRGGLEVSRGNLGLNQGRFDREGEQITRANTFEDEDRASAAAATAGRLSFLDEVASGQTDPNRRNTVRGLKYNVTLPDLRSAQERGTDAGVEEGAAFDAGGRRVRQATVDMGTQSGIAQADAAARRARENRPLDTAADTAAIEAADTATEVSRLAKALRNHSGLPGAFGVTSARLPTVRQDTADAETLLASLQGLLTLENMGKMKGVLSDSDMKILRQASTTLNQSMSEGAARTELDRLQEVMSKVTGEESAPSGPAGAITVTAGGKTYRFADQASADAFKKAAGIK